MTEPWLIRVYDNQQLVCVRECLGPVVLGRQDTLQAKPEQLFELSKPEGGGCRLVIALHEEVSVSRQHARLVPVEEGKIGITNLSSKVGFTTGNNRLGKTHVLKPGQHWHVELPAVLEIGKRVIHVQAVSDHESAEILQSLAEPTLAPLRDEVRHTGLPSFSTRESNPFEGEHMIRWVKATQGVLQSAATDSDFFRKAAQAVVDVGQMDTGRVLMRDDDEWNTVAHSGSPGSESDFEPPSRLVLRKVCENKRTFWFDPLQVAEKEGNSASSLAGVHAALAAPILDRQGQVIGVLYGERRITTFLATNRMLSKVDAVLVDLLAGGVAAGLARVEQERKALALRTQFEQFFTPDLARQLVEQPELLVAKDLEITTLFCDIQAFSRISRDLGPALTLEWVSDVMSTLSDCVLNHHGVLVDYIGDALMAMWGAPRAQPEHPEQACRAALDMLKCLPSLNARWQETLRVPMNVTIGINTGLARVGNTGSKHKFKYGPLGDTVNVASRVQGAAKYFKASLLVTRATKDQLGPEFHARRLGLVRVHNIADALELYELFADTHPLWSELATEYEAALSEFEARRFRQSARQLGLLVNKHTDDGPAFALLARAIGCIVEEPVPFDPAFRLPGK